MPNHVTHHFKIEGTEDDIKKFIDECFDEESSLNFNKIIPMPTILENTISGNTSEMQTKDYKSKEEQAIEATGHKNWYDWRLEHWGTKWNAYSVRCDNHGDFVELEFDTAWSCPERIFKTLSEKYTTLIFDGYALDEGFCFGAAISIHDGELSIDYFDVNAGLMEAFSYRFV